MHRWIAPLVGAVIGLGALTAQAQVCNLTISPPSNVSTTIVGMTSGQTLCLNPGTYAPPVNPDFPANGSFGFGVGVTVRGLGADPSAVVLASTNTNDHAIYVVNYVGGKNANGGSLVNLTITGGGVQIFNFTAPATRITDFKLKDVVINTSNPASFGVLSQQSDRVVLDNVTISSRLTALNFVDTTDSLVMNSTISNTINASAAALAVLGGNGNRFIRNTFGQPRLSAGAGYSFNGGAVVFDNTSDNRFEGNVVQGMLNDAVDFTIADLSANGLPLAKATYNYVGKNSIIHTAFPLNGSIAGSAGIWSNCASDGTWIFGNYVEGTAESGLTVFEGRNNMLLGNVSYNNGIVGTYLSGDQTSINDCIPAGNTTFRQKPLNNYIIANANLFNKNDQVVVRDADNTILSRNFSTPLSGLGGSMQACVSPACHAGYSIETDATVGRDTTTGTRLIGNTTLNNARGFWAQSFTSPGTLSVTGMTMFVNKMIGAANSRWISGPVNIDGGSFVGGNYWTNFATVGNPSASAYNGVLHNEANNTGNVVDRFPYQSENLGRGYGITITEPRSGASIARGTKRTVRWESPGCTWVTLSLGASTLVSNAPNTGYSIVTIPVGQPMGNQNIVATCKDAAGTVRGTSNGPTFAVTSENLTIVSPGRDETLNTSAQVWVGWTNPTHLTSVSIDSSVDGGATWTALGTLGNTGVGQSANRVTSFRMGMSATASANAMVRVRSGGTVAACGTNCDEMDGVFQLRAAGAGTFDTATTSQTHVMGQVSRLRWSSPQGSRLVTINATSGAVVNVATDLPDRGFFDWLVPELTSGTVQLSITYKNAAGGTILGPVNVAGGGAMRRANTITYGPIPTIIPGGSQPITITTSTGVAATLTSSTPSVCTVSGNTITGVANGVCTVTANSAGNATYAAASPSTISFNVGQSQTISFVTQKYIGVGTTVFIGASATSGLPVTLSSLTPGICTVTGGNTLNGTGVGTCTVAADQPGDGTYAAAPQVTRNLESMAPANIPRIMNISTRGRVGAGGDVMIAGFIIGGTQAKTVVVNVAGPHLANFGISDFLVNPTLTLVRSSDNAIIASNDNWQTQTVPGHVAQIQATGFQPNHPNEPAIIATLPPGAYTAIVQGAGGTTGVGLVGLFEVDHFEVPLVNISTRMQVGTGGDVMIAGFIIQGSAPQTVVINVAGPHLANFGITGFLANPQLQVVRSADNVTLATNDNWQTQTIPGDVAAITATGFQPNHPNEPAIILTLPPGAYTAIVTGVGNTTGNGLVGVFLVQ